MSYFTAWNVVLAKKEKTKRLESSDVKEPESGWTATYMLICYRYVNILFVRTFCLWTFCKISTERRERASERDMSDRFELRCFTGY